MSTQINALRILKDVFTNNIYKHRLNIQVMLENPMAIHDHTDYMGAIESEIAKIAEYHDKLEVLEKYLSE